MASAAAPAPLSRPLRAQNSHPGLTPANTSPAQELVENQGITGILKALPIITAVISTLLNGVAAAAILSEENGILATDINPTHDRDVVTFLDFSEIVLLVSGLSFFLAVDDSRRTWLIGSGILCPLIFACRFARTGNHFFILRTLIGLLVAVMLPMSWRFIVPYTRSPGLKMPVLLSSATALTIGPLSAWNFGIGLSEVYSWQLSFSIISTSNAVLFLLSIIVLPSDLERQEPADPLLIFRFGLRACWLFIAGLATYLGRLSYKLASVLSEFPF